MVYFMNEYLYRYSQDFADKNETLRCFTQLCCNIRMNNNCHAFPVFFSEFLFIFNSLAQCMYLCEVKKVMYNRR